VRIPFPERIPINRVAIFAVVLFLIQQMEHTALYFSGGCAAFILIAAFAFNMAGGLTRASGAYVFFYSTLVVILGICYKAYLGEPAQSNLLDPHTTIEAYVGSIAAMLAAVIVSRHFARKSGLLQNVLKESEMYRSAIGCIVFGAAAPFLISLLGESGAKLATAFAQLNKLIPLGIIIGVMYQIRRSGGTRSLNLPILLTGIYFFVYYGIANFSKEGMLTPMVCWFIPVCALRYRLSALQVLSCLLTVFIVFHYLVPYSQYGRRFNTPGLTLQQRIAITTQLLEHPEDTRQKFKETVVETSYFNTPQGFWDRLQFVSVDDGLINLTDQGRVFGLTPLVLAAENAVPHVFWKNKPYTNFGNVYMHEITGVAEDEETGVGISFSPTSEAYHMATWAGILVVAPLVWFLLFVVFDSLFGDLRTSPWGLLALVMISHIAPEGGLTDIFYLLSFGTEALIFCALFATWVAPAFADTLLGPRPAVPATLAAQIPQT
jgi:hypothetical protein